MAGYGSEVHAVYKHPQGKTITVFVDGTFECRGPDGKRDSSLRALRYHWWYSMDAWTRP